MPQRVDSVHNFVEFCFQFRYWMFKTVEYLNNRKVAEAVSRFLSPPVDPLFYLSSFQNQMEAPSAEKRRGFSFAAGKAHGLFRQTFAVCRAQMPSSGDDGIHTCSLRSIWGQVHALTPNDFDFFAALRQTLRGCQALKPSKMDSQPSVRACA